MAAFTNDIPLAIQIQCKNKTVYTDRKYHKEKNHVPWTMTIDWRFSKGVVVEKRQKKNLLVVHRKVTYLRLSYDSKFSGSSSNFPTEIPDRKTINSIHE